MSRTKIALLVAFALTGAAVAQEFAEPHAGPGAGQARLAPAFAFPAEQPVALDHRANLRAEWVADFRRAWAAADEPARQAAREVLAELRSIGAPAEMRPDLGSIEVARRVLAGQPAESLLAEDTGATLAIQALSLDLRVTPGAFEAGTQKRTRNLTVHVEPLFELRDSIDVSVRLRWIGPDGASFVAREEAVRAAAFRAPGFDMFVRAPRSEPGLWQLQAELVPDQVPLASAVTRPVPVVAYERAPVTGDAARAFAALVERGERVSPDATRLASDWLASLLGDAPETAPTPDPGTLATEPQLLIAAPSERIGAPLFADLEGRAWRAAAERAGQRLVSIAPANGGVEPRVGAHLRAHADTPVCLVLIGDAVLATQLEFLQHGAGPFDRLVVVANAWRPTPLLASVPTLLLTPDATAARIAGAADHVTAVELDDTLFLAAPELPARIAAWLVAEAATAKGTSAEATPAGAHPK